VIEKFVKKRFLKLILGLSTGMLTTSAGIIQNAKLLKRILCALYIYTATFLAINIK
jgi:hypothetical protein